MVAAVVVVAAAAAEVAGGSDNSRTKEGSVHGWMNNHPSLHRVTYFMSSRLSRGMDHRCSKGMDHWCLENHAIHTFGSPRSDPYPFLEPYPYCTFIFRFVQGHVFGHPAFWHVNHQQLDVFTENAPPPLSTRSW